MVRVLSRWSPAWSSARRCPALWRPRGPSRPPSQSSACGRRGLQDGHLRRIGPLLPGSGREFGKTSEGRRWYLALIASPANLAAEGRAFVDISGGLHASELAGAQHTIQLDPTIDAILGNVVLMLWPSLNPDGQSIVVNWYRETVGTPYEAAPLHEIYQKYVGHDNNRDAAVRRAGGDRDATPDGAAGEHHRDADCPGARDEPPRAPTAFRIPISRVRSVTDDRSTFMMPIPPTRSEIPTRDPKNNLARRIPCSTSASCSAPTRFIIRPAGWTNAPPRSAIAR